MTNAAQVCATRDEKMTLGLETSHSTLLEWRGTAALRWEVAGGRGGAKKNGEGYFWSWLLLGR